MFTTADFFDFHLLYCGILTVNVEFQSVGLRASLSLCSSDFLTKPPPSLSCSLAIIRMSHYSIAPSCLISPSKPLSLCTAIQKTHPLIWWHPHRSQNPLCSSFLFFLSSPLLPVTSNISCFLRSGAPCTWQLPALCPPLFNIPLCPFTSSKPFNPSAASPLCRSR